MFSFSFFSFVPRSISNSVSAWFADPEVEVFDAPRELSQTVARSRLSRKAKQKREHRERGKGELVAFSFFFFSHVAYVATRWLAPAMNGFLHARELVRQFFFFLCKAAREEKPRGVRAAYSESVDDLFYFGATVSDVEAILKSRSVWGRKLK